MGGSSTTSSGDFSVAMGYHTNAGGLASIAMGDGTMASGDHSTAMGDGTTASGWYSTAMGKGIEAHEAASLAASGKVYANDFCQDRRRAPHQRRHSCQPRPHAAGGPLAGGGRAWSHGQPLRTSQAQRNGVHGGANHWAHRSASGCRRTASCVSTVTSLKLTNDKSLGDKPPELLEAVQGVHSIHLSVVLAHLVVPSRRRRTRSNLRRARSWRSKPWWPQCRSTAPKNKTEGAGGGTIVDVRTPVVVRLAVERIVWRVQLWVTAIRD